MFTGFPAAGFQFLRDLAANNNKAWFEAHKAQYIEQVQTPALALVAALGERLQAQFPEIRYDLRTNGGGSLMRLYRDTRFSSDKSPYKTNVAMMFMPANTKKMESAGFGLQFTPHDVGTMAGIFGFSKPMLERYREAVLEKKLGQELDDAVAAVRAAGDYTLGGETYKRIPQGLDASHPRAGWLKYTGLHVYSPALNTEAAASPAFVDTVMTHFLNMSPVYRWLAKALA
jgi:uncharacterized protein (TIGR02453 family)